jgi:hypothetical protein
VVLLSLERHVSSVSLIMVENSSLMSLTMVKQSKTQPAPITGVVDTGEATKTWNMLVGFQKSAMTRCNNQEHVKLIHDRIFFEKILMTMSL